MCSLRIQGRPLSVTMLLSLFFLVDSRSILFDAKEEASQHHRSNDEDSDNGRISLSSISSPLHNNIIQAAQPLQYLQLDQRQRQQQRQRRLYRKLNWDAFNNIISRAVVKFPDSELEAAGLTLKVTNLQCTNVLVDQISVAPRPISAQQIMMDTTITGLDMTCTARYEFGGYLIVSGSGDLFVESLDNSAMMGTVFESLDYGQYPPHDSSVASCQPTININKLEFSNGGFWGWTLDQLEGMFRGSFEAQAESRLCEELEYMTNQNMDSMLNEIQNTLVQYPENIAIDPLASEQLIDAFYPDDTFINWQDPGSYPFGYWMNRAWQDAVAYLSREVDINGKVDLNANVMLREHILDDNVLTIDINVTSDHHILYQGHDKWMQTAMKLHQVRIRGLDTLTAMDPMVPIGMFTLGSSLLWQSLSLELDLSVDILPSTLPESYISVQEPNLGIYERFTAQLNLTQVNAGISILLALDQDDIEALKVGHFLDKDNILSCFLSSVSLVQVSALSAEAMDIQPPQVSGFASQGLEQLVSNAVQGGFLMYESSMLRSSKAFFQTVVRDAVNLSLEAKRDTLTQGEKCTLWDLPQPIGSVDVRELLMEPQASISSGGPGEERYGNLFYGFVVPTLQNEVLKDDKMNDRFIRPITSNQSGQEGTLVSTSPWINFVREGNLLPQHVGDSPNRTEDANWVTLMGWERFQFQAKDAVLSNIDTVTSPLEVLNPLDSQLLGNTIRTGNQTLGRPLQLTIRLVAEAQGSDGSDAPDMFNDVAISITVPSSLFSFEMYVAMNETSLVHFPLKTLDNEFCWLAALTDQATPSLNMARIVAKMPSSFSLDVTCVSCSSPGGQALPEVLSIMKTSGLIDLLQPYVEDFIADVVRGAWDGMDFPAMIDDAPRRCPHHALYDPTAVPRDDYGLANVHASMPKWSRRSAETISALGVLSAYTSLFVVAKNYLLQPQETVILNAATNTTQSSPTIHSDIQDIKLLDWTNLSATLGPWADAVLEEARTALQESVANQSATLSRRLNTHEMSEAVDTNEVIPRLLQADSFIRDHILDEEGSMVFVYDDIEFEFAGIVFSLHQVRTLGMDSITHIDPFIVTGPQTLQNNVKLQELEVSLDLGVRMDTESHNMTVDFVFQHVAIDFPLLLAMDLDKLGQIELGRLLRVKQILPCLLGGAREVYIPNLNVTVGSMERPTIAGFLSPELLTVVKSMTQALFDAFGDELVVALPGIFDSTIRQIFNRRLQQYMSRLDPTLCTVEAGGGVIDFRDLFLEPTASKDMGGTGMQQYGDLFESLHRVMRQEFETKSGEPPSINKMLSSWTADHFNESGTITIPGNLVDTSSSMKLAGLDAVLAFQLGHISLENVDSLGDPLSLLDPLDANTLNNTASLGVGGEPLRVKARLVLAISDDADVQVRNEVDISVDLYTAKAGATVLLRIAEDAFLKFPLKDTTNIFCWLATILPTKDGNYGVSLLSHFLSIGDMHLNVTCVSCTSPKFGDLISDLYAPANAEEATATVLQTFSQILGGDAIQDFLDQIVAESSSKCPHSDAFDPNALITASEYLHNQAEPLRFTDFTARDYQSSYFNIASGIFAGCLLLFFVMGKLLVYRSNKKWKESLSAEGMFLLRRQEAREREQEAVINSYSSSLFESPHIPQLIRWLVPLFLMINIGLFIGGHLGILATINLECQLAGENVTIRNFMDFSFIASTSSTYRNGGMEMSIMLWIMTGIWPYVKLLASLFLWLVPPRLLSVRSRGKLLLWIDALTKLSIVDIFTFILFLAVLLVYIGGPDEALDADGVLYSMKVIVVPGAGCYCLVIAQRMSRASSQFFLDYHEKVVQITREACARGDVEILHQEHEMKVNPLANQMESSEVWTSAVVPGQSFLSLSSGSSNEDRDRPIDYPLPQGTRPPEVISEEIHFGNIDSEEQAKTALVDSEVTSILENRLLPAPEHDCESDREFPTFDNAPSCTGTEKESPVKHRSMCARLKSIFFCGQVGVVSCGIAVVAILVVGCIYAPSVSVEISDLWALALESGKTYEEAATNYGVFSIVSAVLLQSSFVLNTTLDYVALGFLLAVTFIAIGMVFFLGCYHFIRRLFKDGWSAIRFNRGTSTSELPGYLRLHAYKHFEIYVVAVIVGCWQLGSVSIYAIHLYCSMLDSLYRVLAYIGLTQPSSVQCFEAQMKLVDNLLIFFGVFFILLAKFAVQCSSQYQKNISEAYDLLQHEDNDVVRLSTVWNTPTSPKRSFLSSSFYALNQTASSSDLNSAVDESPSMFASARSSSPFVFPTEAQAQKDKDSISVSTMSASPGRKDDGLGGFGELPSQ